MDKDEGSFIFEDIEQEESNENINSELCRNPSDEMYEEFKYNQDVIKIDEYFHEEKLVKSKSESPHMHANGLNPSLDDNLALKTSNDERSDLSDEFDDQRNKFTFGNLDGDQINLINSKSLCRNSFESGEKNNIFCGCDTNNSKSDFCKFEIGEDEISFIKVQALDGNDNKKYEGNLMITRYKIVFRPFEENSKNEICDDYSCPTLNEGCVIETNANSNQNENLLYADLPIYKRRFFCIPVHLLYSVKLSKNKKNINETYIDIDTKDMRVIRFIVSNDQKGDKLFEDIQKIAFPKVLCKEVFSLKFKYNVKGTTQENLKLPVNGWEVYDFNKEYKRQGVENNSESFRVQKCWHTDKGENICDTYPHEVYVPAKVTYATLMECANFRSRRRFPALSYYYSKKGSSLWRSSQNSPGMMGSRCEADEEILHSIGQINQFCSQVSIYDARSRIKAYSNKVKGGGFEHTDYYTNCDIIFCSIENIHGVDKAFKKIFSLVCSCSRIKNNNTIFSSIENSGWYSLIQAILYSAYLISIDLDINRRSVLVHCSDGWDRTAQLCSLAQIVLDPYYRTLEGIEVIIEKEWVSFGHCFESRCGHLYDENTK